MSSADRRRVGRVASALAAGETRSAILSRRLADTPRTAASVGSLEKAPDWLCREPAERRQLGYRAALAGLGPALATSIDGRWLGGLAAVAGEDALDWASARCGTVAVLPMFDGSELDVSPLDCCGPLHLPILRTLRRRLARASPLTQLLRSV